MHRNVNMVLPYTSPAATCRVKLTMANSLTLLPRQIVNTHNTLSEVQPVPKMKI